MYRQGDVLLVPCPRPLADERELVKRKKGEGIILAEGEATGHHHRIKDRSVNEWLVGPHWSFSSDKKRVITVGKNGATLTHEEHDPIKIEPGAYEIVRQREWAPPVASDRRDRWSYVAD